MVGVQFSAKRILKLVEKARKLLILSQIRQQEDPSITSRELIEKSGSKEGREMSSHLVFQIQNKKYLPDSCQI